MPRQRSTSEKPAKALPTSTLKRDAQTGLWTHRKPNRGFEDAKRSGGDFKGVRREGR